MKTIKVTSLEKQVLEALAKEMYAECGFSNAGLPEIKQATGLSTKTIRGVASSLTKKNLIEIWDREGDIGVNPRDPNTHIWYLTSQSNGLVPHWVEEEDIEPVELITE